MDVVMVSFGDKSDEEKTEEPLMDVVMVSFGDKSCEEATEEKTEEPLMDVEESTEEPILNTVKVSFGDIKGEEAMEESDVRKEDNVKMTTTLVTWGQGDIEKHHIINKDGVLCSIIKVKEDWKPAKDELDGEEGFEKDEDSDLPKSVSTSSFHSLSEDEVRIKF